MSKRFSHCSFTVEDVSRELIRCASECGSSLQRSLALPHLATLCRELGQDIVTHQYLPGQYTRFAVSEPKLREIYAPQFRDRLAQTWLVRHAQPLLERRMIEDSFANQTGRGPLKAVQRVQQLCRRPGHRYVLQLDVRNFFNSIRHDVIMAQWHPILDAAGLPTARHAAVAHLSRAILCHDVARSPFSTSGDRTLLARIPPHKRLGFAGPGIGLPIGSLSSQLFANFMLNPLDQQLKHQLKVRGYVRYMDDLLLLSDQRDTLLAWQEVIADTLTELGLSLHPNKQYMGICEQGFDYLGYRVYPHHLHIRQRNLKALRARIRWFEYLISGHSPHPIQRPPGGKWGQQPLNPPVPVDGALLRQMLATLNSYWGLLAHANHLRLRKHFYEHELGLLKPYFVPGDEKYRHLRLKSVWR
ncbi:reverse transcriptase domain-containing protein [Aeromonas sp. 602200]|uniref:RNA-directed DNA polymerase n=1 Tax=Aeromonas sp. 602200 TaxID=2712040 RepID=UPI003BA2FFDE